MNAHPGPASRPRRVVIHRPGGHGRLAFESFEPRPPGSGELRVAVRAVGVNFADSLVRMGVYAPARRYVGWPITPGFEAAGIIEATGPDVDPARTGQAVVALTRFGAFASHVTIPAAQAFPLPEGWSMAAGAALAVNALTADHALALAAPPPGTRVLVHSAAGGVGLWLTQLAAAADLDVTGTVGRAGKVATVVAHGAQRCVVRGSAEERALGADFAAVFDAQDPASWRRSYALLAPTGRLVVYGAHGLTTRGRIAWLRAARQWWRRPRFDPMRLCGDNKGVLGFNLAYLFDRAEQLGARLDAIAAMVDRGRVRPPPVTTLPFAEVAAAQRRLESGATVGKLVLTLEP